MPANFNPECVYEKSTDSSGNPVWSTYGCKLVDVQPENDLAICSCTHMSRFSVGENISTLDVEVSDVWPLTGPSDDTDFNRQPVMIFVCSFFWLIIIITIVADRLVLSKRQRIIDRAESQDGMQIQT
jgi:hypothetical protein